MSLRAPPLASIELTLVAGVDQKFFQAYLQRYFIFFSFRAFGLEVLLFSEFEEYEGFGF